MKRLPWIEIMLIAVAVIYFWHFRKVMWWQGPVEEKYVSHVQP